MGEARKDFGLMRKLFENYSKNIALYITFIVLVLLIVVGLVHILLLQEYTQTTNFRVLANYWPNVTIQ